jgi:hypothetical protein
VTILLGYCVTGIGIVLLAIGYFRKSRNLMLAGTIALLVGAGWRDFVKGGVAGWNGAR